MIPRYITSTNLNYSLITLIYILIFLKLIILVMFHDQHDSNAFFFSFINKVNNPLVMKNNHSWLPLRKNEESFKGILITFFLKNSIFLTFWPFRAKNGFVHVSTELLFPTWTDILWLIWKFALEKVQTQGCRMNALPEND